VLLMLGMSSDSLLRIFSDGRKINSMCLTMMNESWYLSAKSSCDCRRLIIVVDDDDHMKMSEDSSE